MKILDCTLRDGGYYTNWDFDSDVVSEYASCMEKLPVEYLEVGYRNNSSSGYMGQFGYTPVSTLRMLREKTRKKIAVMLNEKSTTPADLDRLLKPIIGLTNMVRIAVDPKNFDRAVGLARAVKAFGFEVAFNLMYMSKWVTDPSLLSKFSVLDGVVDLFCMVDSYGGVQPEDVKVAIAEVRKSTNVPIGFHGHNNLQLALINTLIAIDYDVDFVDATILGMGRGAGNLNLELLLSYLNRHANLNVDFNVLGDVVSAFTPLQDKYRWGTNLPYMISGANDIPQKEVMEWVTNRVYSFNSVVRALDNRRNKAADNARFPEFCPNKKYASVVIVGGGPNAISHVKALREYLSARKNIALVFSTARYAAAYLDIPNDCYYCLVGNEGRRLIANLSGKAKDGICILPPYPREMGTEVPESVQKYTFELPRVDFTDKYRDSVTTVALQLARMLSDDNILLIGYDGYPGMVLSEKEMALTHENQHIFAAFCERYQRELKSLTPTLYPELPVESVYQFL